MVDNVQTEFHGGLQKIFRLDFYFWHLRRSVRTGDWQAVRDHLESLWMELGSWMDKTERDGFIVKWTVLQQEYKKMKQKDRTNTFKAQSIIVELYLRGITKVKGLDMKEQKPYSGGGAIWQG